MTPPDLTIVFPHFMNLGMLAEQHEVWSDYPQWIKNHLHVIVVDDCSPEGEQPDKKSLYDTGLASTRLYRLLEKVRWNWLACRNLGAKEAATEWLLLTDIDHVIPARTLERIIAGPLSERNCYRFNRLTATRTWPYASDTCTPYKMHNDTWLLTRSLFFDPRVGGYDERLSGCYGTSGEFRDRLMSAAKAHVVLTEPIIRYPREVIPDASTLPSVYTRKNDTKNDQELQARKNDRDKIAGWKPLHGLTPWEFVAAVPCAEEAVA